MKNTERGYEAPKDLLQQLEEQDFKRDIVLAAIDRLKDEEDIREFFKQYVERRQETHPDEMEVNVAEYIRIALGYYSKEYRDRWEKVLGKLWKELGDAASKKHWEEVTSYRRDK